MLSLFTDHPKSVDETYIEHMSYACPTGMKMIAAGLACFIHGLFPFLFAQTGSKMTKKIAEDMKSRTPKNSAN